MSLAVSRFGQNPTANVQLVLNQLGADKHIFLTSLFCCITFFFLSDSDLYFELLFLQNSNLKFFKEIKREIKTGN